MEWAPVSLSSIIHQQLIVQTVALCCWHFYAGSTSAFATSTWKLVNKLETGRPSRLHKSCPFRYGVHVISLLLRKYFAISLPIPGTPYGLAGTLCNYLFRNVILLVAFPNLWLECEDNWSTLLIAFSYGGYAKRLLSAVLRMSGKVWNLALRNAFFSCWLRWLSEDLINPKLYIGLFFLTYWIPLK